MNAGDDIWFDAKLCVCEFAERGYCGLGAQEASSALSPDQGNDSMQSHNIAAIHSSGPSKSLDNDKVLNLTERDLPHMLSQLLSNGPSFALSQTICKKILHSVEKGIERGAFALRWKLHLMSKRDQFTIRTSLIMTSPTHSQMSLTPATHRPLNRIGQTLNL